MQFTRQYCLAVWDNNADFLPGAVNEIEVGVKEFEVERNNPIPELGKLLPHEEGALAIQILTSHSPIGRLHEALEALDKAAECAQRGSQDGNLLTQLLDTVLTRAFREGVAHAARRDQQHIPWPLHSSEEETA